MLVVSVEVVIVKIIVFIRSHIVTTTVIIILVCHQGTKKRTSQISKCEMLLRIVKETQRKSSMSEPQVA